MLKSLFKSDITRLFALGFAGGTALVFAGMADEPATSMANGLAPLAHAAEVE